MKLFRRQSRSGFALLVVLVLIVLLLAYSIVAQTSVLSSRTVAKSNRQAFSRMQQRASILETIQAGKLVPGTNEFRISVDQPVSGALAPMLMPLAGDVVVTIDWRQPPMMTEKYLVNAQRRRVGAIRLASAAATASTGTLTQAGVGAP